MLNYLPETDAMYTGEILTLLPSSQIKATSVFLQSVHATDGGNPRTVTLKETPDYIIPLMFKGVKPADRNTLFDLFHNPAKAMGSARSFCWKHPDDDINLYVVRFEGAYNETEHTYGRYDVSITLKVIGYKVVGA